MDDTPSKRRQREQKQEQTKRNDFSTLVRVHIRERDGERCVLCGKPGREVHHIIPRVQGGLGTADNGVCLDAVCHHQAHRSKQVEKQLLRYRERVLLPRYGLAPGEYVWLDPLPDALCRCGGQLADGACAAQCGLMLLQTGEESRG
ncbi:HNH endonuclease [Tumebacillus sp. BK434]|uniref:HNH endonuclease n=1 Tax=Tumebacillus sp. BK434 TaxID=2512169 RepID=UPI0010EB45B8|nr:HNH endonuclease signature motif containing protein [Tumebacillus sp. BK434]TCP53947.1 HNH endonuclease [Tumebacillus sp. BK434]